MKFKFVSLEEGFVPKVVDDFFTAWLHMYEWVKAKLDAGQLDWQLLETAIWIEQSGPKGTVPIYFYDARDRAIDAHNWKP